MAMLLGTACSGDQRDGGAATADAPTSSTADSGDVPVAGGTLVFALAGENTGYNPAADQVTLSGYQVTNAVYDTLVRRREDGTWHPYLAESLTPNEDFTEWEIGLRPDVTFHDGTPLDSAVLKMNLDAQRSSPLLGQAVGAIDHVDVVDDLTVNVVMADPWSSFPYTLSTQPGLVAAPSVLQDAGGSSNPVGTGPFVFEQWTRDKTLTVKRNDDYWRSGYPLLDRIEFQVIADPASRTAALRSGDVDIIEVREGEQLAEWEAEADEGEYIVHVDDQGETTEDVLFFNTAIPPFDDPVAREAVATAIDKETYSRVLSNGRFPPADGPFKEGSPWHAGVDFVSYDPDRSTELAARYAATHGEPIEFVFKSGIDPKSVERAALLQEMLGERGITMTAETGEGTTQLVEVLLGDYQSGTADLLWGSVHPDIESVFIRGENALPPGQMGIAFTRVDNPAIDAALQTARDTVDQSEQAEQWAIIQQEIADDMNWVFLAHDDIGDVASTKVKGIADWEFPDGTPGKTQSQNVLSVYQMWLEE